jgi:hypothetical protein
MAEHLPEIIEGLETFVSDQIEKGSLWFHEVRTQLQEANAGLLCLTPENVGSPWLHYEAGALAASLEDAPARRIYTYLLGLDPRDLTGPLAAYQSTVADESDTKMLVDSLARTLGAIDVGRTSSDRYGDWWQRVSAAIEAIPAAPLVDVLPDFESLFRRKTFDEPLVECTHQRWVDRYVGARDTARELTAHRQRVRSACRGYVNDLYADLCGLVDAYAMDMRAFLIEEKHFDTDETGRLQVDPPGAAVACERRRRDVKARVSQLLDVRLAPVFEDACRFAMLETFAEKKNLIHRTTDEIERGSRPLTDAELTRAAVSDWDFDRIAFYVVEERRAAPDLPASIERVRMELEKARASEGASHMPLHYSLGPLKVAARVGDTATKSEVEQVLEDVERLIDDRDGGGQMRMTITEIRATA